MKEPINHSVCTQGTRLPVNLPYWSNQRTAMTFLCVQNVR